MSKAGDTEQNRTRSRDEYFRDEKARLDPGDLGEHAVSCTLRLLIQPATERTDDAYAVDHAGNVMNKHRGWNDVGGWAITFALSTGLLECHFGPNNTIVNPDNNQELGYLVGSDKAVEPQQVVAVADPPRANSFVRLPHPQEGLRTKQLVVTH